jgi:hypothetical protein
MPARRRRCVITEIQTRVRVDYYQYYAYGVGGDFDESSVDLANDGILAPGATGVRISTGAHYGEADLTIRVVDKAIALPVGDSDLIASACNMDLPEGVIMICHWGGLDVYQYDFGRPLTCGFFVEVHGRDDAHDHRYEPDPLPIERHVITISPIRFSPDRWRSKRIDRAGAPFVVYADHVDNGSG